MNDRAQTTPPGSLLDALREALPAPDSAPLLSSVVADGTRLVFRFGIHETSVIVGRDTATFVATAVALLRSGALQRLIDRIEAGDV